MSDWEQRYRELSEVVKNLQVSLEQADEKLKHALNNMNHNLTRAERAEAALRRISKGIDDPRTTQNIAVSALEAGDE